MGEGEPNFGSKQIEEMWECEIIYSPIRTTSSSVLHRSGFLEKAECPSCQDHAGLSFEFFFAEYLLLLKPGIDYPYWHATC
jgi:hypothetical protein